MSAGGHRRFKRRLLARIARRAAAASDPISAGLLRRERSRFLGSHAVQCATLYDIWVEELGAAEATQRWEAVQILPIVPKDICRFRSPPVEWCNMPRRTSGFRKICKFGDVEKMWHRMARDLITSQHEPRAHVGDWPGRGRDQQIRSLLAAVRSRKQAVVCADIRRAFASVNTDAAYDLHFLPEPMIRRALDHRTHSFVRRERRRFAEAIASAIPSDLEVAPSGLMEGSPASNAIFSVLMDDLPDHVGSDIHVFSYCDNIILLAPSIEQAQRAEIALVAYFTSHRAGPFEVVTHAQSVSSPFDHLGYELQWHRGMKASLSLTNWLRFMERIEQGDAEAAQLYVRSSFPACTASHLANYETIIAEAARDFAGYP
jgi:hypothetical protein